MARAPLSEGHVRKLFEFDAETWRALQLFSRESMRDLQELADEAFGDLLRKHGRPVTLKEALRESARIRPGPPAGPRAPRGKAKR